MMILCTTSHPSNSRRKYINTDNYYPSNMIKSFECSVVMSSNRVLNQPRSIVFVRFVEAETTDGDGLRNHFTGHQAVDTLKI